MRRLAVSLAQRVASAQDVVTRTLFLPRRTAGVAVTPDTALTFSAVWGCVRIISETVAQLPWHVYRENRDGGRERQPNHVVDYLLHTRPNPEMSAEAFRTTLIHWALLWGNGYAEIERTRAGGVNWLWPIAPDRVEVLRADQELIEWEGLENVRPGEIVYRVDGSRGATFIPADDMFHLKGLGFDGLVGYSVAALARRAIGLGIALDQNAAAFFANGSRPSGAIKVSGTMKPEAKDETRREWRKLHGGPENQYNVAIFDQGAEFVPMSMPNNDAQFLESRRFQVAEISRWFRVQMHKLSELDRATHSNIEEQNIEFVTDTLMPWIIRLEQEANYKLFGNASRGRLYTKIGVNGLLRGRMNERADFYAKMNDRGFYTINDVLRLEDMNTIGPAGDARFVPLNMTTLERAIAARDETASGGDSPSQAEDLARLAETYAAAVRAGLVTPNVDDEQTFREAIGFPSPNEDVKAAWERQRGVRQPVTLQNPRDTEAAGGEQPPDPPDTEPDEQPQDRTRAALIVMAGETWQRICAREHHRLDDLGRMSRAGKVTFTEAVEEFYSKNRQYVEQQLVPIRDAAAALCDVPADRLQPVIVMAAGTHCEVRSAAAIKNSGMGQGLHASILSAGNPEPYASMIARGEKWVPPSPEALVDDLITAASIHHRKEAA